MVQFSIGEQLRGRTLPEARYRFPERPDKFLLFQMQRGHCFYCDRPMQLNGQRGDCCSRDHIVPQSSGKFVDVMVAACIDCNSLRSSAPAHIFMLVMHALIEAQGGVLREHPMQRRFSPLRRKIVAYLDQFGRTPDTPSIYQ